ncbi:hypothetical protein BsWGS_10468 [Bradybaena similaris]
MKGRFSTADIIVIIQELKRFLTMRVINVYDIDNKTYLIRVGKPDEKTVILLESGIRLHSTEFDWPKNPAPSGFSMKLRKHLKGRRLESVAQLGVDRIVDLQFGSGEAAYHVILELYDRGNMVLTDHEYTILTLLRPRTDTTQDVKFAVREKYPVDCSKTHQPPTEERIMEFMKTGKDGDVLKKLLIPNLDYGPAIIDHVLLGAGFPENVKFGKGFSLDADFPRLMSAIHEAEDLLKKFMAKPCKGYIIKKKDKKPNPQPGEEEDIWLYEEFHPYLYRQHSKMAISEFERFDQAVDEFFSKIESQRLDLKIIQQEKTILKKLEHVKKDNEKRIEGLQKEQETDILRGQLIEMNLALVDQAILIVNSAVANQIDWTEIWNLVKEAQLTGDNVANAIKALKLDSNQITLLLHDPFATTDTGTDHLKPMRVDIDLGISAYANSKKYFDKRRQAAKKEQKTVEASKKALKSAERKTKQTLKDVATAASINKTRKTFWFEKFLWFISSENYLVIGGRDQQQNEIIVKRYMRPGDLYVHADLHGASSCVIKNPGGNPVPPKTLNEAGTMAICNSAAWDSKVVTSAWWVYHDQVSKTAPSGEYLTTGSFMIRGKKNFLPPSYLIYGFGFMFKLEDGSIERHKGERRVKVADDDAASVTDSAAASVPESDDIDDMDINISDGSSSEEDDEVEEQSLVTSGGIASSNPSQNTDDVDWGDHGDSLQISERNISDEDEAQADSEIAADRMPTSKEMSEAKVNSAVTVGEEPVKDEGQGFEFPDTSINLLHVKGDKYELHRQWSTASTNSDKPDTFFLGDGMPVTLGEKISSKSGKLSAKQRRDLKKLKKGQTNNKSQSDEEDRVTKDADGVTADVDSDSTDTFKSDNASCGQAGQPKRGQRAKLKKIKEKYADQDEEERRLRMKILASAGPQKDDKKGKGKKGKGQDYPKQQKLNQGPKSLAQKNQVQKKPEDCEQLADLGVAEELDKMTVNEPGEEVVSAATIKQDLDSDGEKDEESNTGNDEAVLNSLTGIPLPEDEIMFAVPVCAPYSALLNYKFKVKLMPGSGKKGKAVKTALNMFVHEKTASAREKDLLKIQKDVDLARNIPGKVKVAAPNIHKHKK